MEELFVSEITKYETLLDKVGHYYHYYEKFSVHSIATGSAGLVHDRIRQCLMGSRMAKKQGKGLKYM